MASFRQLRGLKKVDFLPLKKKNGSAVATLTGGAISGGLLETTLKGEIMQPKAQKMYERNDVFRFVDLPPELRNRIYKLLLTIPGVTYPRTGAPTSTTCRYKYAKKAKRDKLWWPNSALDLLLVNCNIKDEAAGLFYHHNDFVFAHPTHLQAFTLSLGDVRKQSVRNLTLFHNNSADGSVPAIDITLSLLRFLPNLQKFHLLVRYDKHGRIWRFNTIFNGHPGRLEGARTLFTLRGIEDIKVRNLDHEDSWEDRTNADATEKFSIERDGGVLKHFNHGLRLVQKGQVDHELYRSEDWHLFRTYPVLNGSKCSFSDGCSCGDEVDEEDESVAGGETE